jgi:DNA-binding NarL/FixJ family response regulator
MRKLRVFLVDDHQLLRDGLKALIDAQQDMSVVGEAADGLAAVEGVLTARPDVVVMDISMPNLGGAEATEQIKARCPNVRVLALTAHEDPGYAQRLLKAGAAGYVLKRTAAADLVRAIHAVAANGIYLDPAMAGQMLDGPLARSNRRAESHLVSASAELSEREAEVMRLTAEGHTMKAIAATLQLSVRTLETYKTRAMDKLALRNRADVVRYALSRGWL